MLFTGEPVDVDGIQAWRRLLGIAAGAGLFASGAIRWDWGFGRPLFDARAFLTFSRNPFDHFRNSQAGGGERSATATIPSVTVKVDSCRARSVRSADARAHILAIRLRFAVRRSGSRAPVRVGVGRMGDLEAQLRPAKSLCPRAGRPTERADVRRPHGIPPEAFRIEAGVDPVRAHIPRNARGDACAGCRRSATGSRHPARGRTERFENGLPSDRAAETGTPGPSSTSFARSLSARNHPAVAKGRAQFLHRADERDAGTDPRCRRRSACSSARGRVADLETELDVCPRQSTT